MKRSEMLRRIAHWMKAIQDGDDPYLTNIDAAEGFLGFVEANGMLPPSDQCCFEEESSMALEHDWDKE